MLFHHAHDMSSIQKGVLLINFGTPSSPSPKNVRAFVRELFKDQNFSLHHCIQNLFVRTCLLPWRMKRTLARYRAIWTEEGSPFLVNSIRFAQKLSATLPEETVVALGMKYGTPSLSQALEELSPLGIHELLILPLFPQQVPPLTQKIIEIVLRHILRWPRLPRITCISDFYEQPWYISASAARLLQASPEYYDKVVFSFHALPESTSSHFSSYQHLCAHTAKAIGEAARVSPEKISIAFQSKAGCGRWTSPSTREVLSSLIKEEKKRVLVMCPSFVVDCMETLAEIAGEYRADFLGNGGEYLGLVECLNDFSPWVEGVASLV